MNDLDKLLQPKEQWSMSAIDNIYGMSLPEYHTAPMSLVDWDKINETPIFNTYDMLYSSNYVLPENTLNFPYSSVNKAPRNTSAPTLGLSNNLYGLKEKAGKDMFYGASMKTFASVANLFANLATFGTNLNNAHRQAQNTKLQSDVEIEALDNQILYYKNQITDKFNSLIARNTVTMAAKNLRVSSGALLEKMKDDAYDASQDIRTVESNAELKKIALRSAKKQADITKRLQQSQVASNLIYSLGQAGLMIASGGGTMESWGDLYAGAGFGSENGSLNTTVYGSK
jgi:hypothetical protein